MMVISKEAHFEAAHRLPFYNGKCHNLHGHSYFVKVEIGFCDTSAPDQNGILVDFGDIKSVIDQFDHRYLNECAPFDNPNFPPSAENISVVLSDLLLERVRDCRYIKLELHEGLGGNVVKYEKEFLSR